MWRMIMAAASLAIGSLSAVACAQAEPAATLAAARAGQGPELVVALSQEAPPKAPPAESALQLVSYTGPLGEMAGYLTKPHTDAKRRPAIIWISGGDTAIGDFWSPQPRSNDQSAAAFRDAGLVVFYPAARGLNGNPGKIEGYFGELDDLVAATRWLKQQPGVDPDRVYLGGHSSGGTMALLAAEYASEWKAVFAFGPVHDPAVYGPGLWGALPYNPANKAAARLRAPIDWLDSISVPTFVIEGAKRGNVGPLMAMRKINRNAQVRFVVGSDCDHFSVVRPGSEQIAQAITQDRLELLDGDGAFKLQCQ